MLQSSVSRWHFIGAFALLGMFTAGFGLFIFSLVSDETYEPNLPPPPPRAEAILEYWFGDANGNIRATHERLALWSAPSTEQVQEMSQRFMKDVKLAASGDYDGWLRHPRGRLAVIILLTEISRRMSDEKTVLKKQEQSIAIALEGIRKNQDIDITLIERIFFYQPLLASESLEMQNRVVGLYERLHQFSPSSQKDFFMSRLTMAKAQREIIYTYGRFPERNKLLGRESTAQELEYLRRKDL